MTKLGLRSVDIPSIYKFAIGFDHVLDDLMRHAEVSNQSNYPPFNVCMTADGKYFIEIAIAGFSEGEINVNLNDRMLVVTGTKSVDSSIEYLHRGISSRDFQRQFMLQEYVEVLSATVKNGILKIALEQQIPEHKKPRSIKLDYLD